MIYIDDHIDDFDLHKALDAISPQRRQYALRYRQERDQRLCVAAYRLLQRALRLEYGIDTLPRFVYDAVGKPLLDGYPDIHFSLSHCHEAVACVLSNRPVGIDIESYTHYSEQVAATVMSNDEMRHILSSARPDIAFTRLWTMKESFYKLTGDYCNGDIAHMLDETRHCRFTTAVLNKYLYTACHPNIL